MEHVEIKHLKAKATYWHKRAEKAEADNRELQMLFENACNEVGLQKIEIARLCQYVALAFKCFISTCSIMSLL